MGVKQDYLKSAIDSISQIYPEFDKNKIEDIIKRKVKEKLKDPTVVMDNNVTGDNKKIQLTEVCNWIENKKPVISGNATFYVQPEVLESPTSQMLRILKQKRKDMKKEMFKYKPEDDEYQFADLSQMNQKVIMNANYGASGAPTAAFYTKYSPAAITLMAQSIITNMAAFFEGFIGDNMKFYHINECFDWMNNVKSKSEDIPNWIKVPSVSETIQRIRRHFHSYDIINDKFIEKYITNCSEKELIYIFYANNLNEFIRRHDKVINLFKSILTSLPLYEASEKHVPEEFQDQFPNVDKYNNWVSQEMFLNPYNVPNVIQSDLKKLINILDQFIYVPYIMPDSIMKLNNHKRNTVILVDTDSNVINSNLFVNFILDEIFPNETFSRKRLYNEMICINILANILDNGIKKILDLYGRVHNMNEAARKELVMKNEFMFRRLFLMNKKKRYTASIILREGHIMIPYKTEIKGMDFIKAGVTDEVTKKFTKLLEDHILFSETLELHELMKNLKKFESEIRKDLQQGGVKFLRPQTYKNENAYKQVEVGGVDRSQAWSLPVFRGAMIWNELYPNQKIYSFDKVKILKLIATGLSDLEGMKNKYPKEYKLIEKKIFNHANPEILKSGLKVIAIPSNIKEIPEWLIDYIDYDVIISDIIGTFRSVLEALRIEEVNFKTPNGKANLTSSLISI